VCVCVWVFCSSTFVLSQCVGGRPPSLLFPPLAPLPSAPPSTSTVEACGVASSGWFAWTRRAPRLQTGWRSGNGRIVCCLLPTVRDLIGSWNGRMVCCLLPLIEEIPVICYHYPQARVMTLSLVSRLAACRPCVKTCGMTLSLHHIATPLTPRDSWIMLRVSCERAR
jgi:hypothetical protein